MTSKDLKSMNRVELMELLVELTRENESLSDQVDRLQSQLREAREKAGSRAIAIEKAGSIAEAALALNGVFEAAQQSAAQYLENIERLSREQQSICDRMLEETRLKCQEMEIGTQRRCDELYRAAEADASRKWSSLAKNLEETVHQFVHSAANEDGKA